MTTYSPINYDEIVANIRADAAKLAPQPTQLPTVTAPAFEDFANPLGYANTDYEGKLKIQQSWLNQYGQAWRNGGANPEQDLKTYAATVKPTASTFDTDWLDLAKQAANKSISSIANVAANELAPGLIKTGLSNIGASYAQDAKANEASFSPVTRDRQIREAREMAELMAAGGSEVDAAALTARHVAERPVATLAQAAGSMVTQLPAIGLQAVGGALVGTGAGAPVGAGLIAAGRGLGVATSTASVAGEVGQGAYDTVMGLPTSKVSGHPAYKAAYDNAIGLKVGQAEADNIGKRAVAKEAMSEGMKYGAGIGAVSGAISGGFGAGKIAENAGKRAATEFLKRSGIELVSEGTEEAVGQVAQNKAANSGGAGVPLTQGTGSAFVEGAAGGLGLSAASAAAGKSASIVVDKFTTAPVIPTTKEDLVAKTSQMPEYVQTMAADLIDTVIANPNPTPEMAAGIEAAKAQLATLGMTEADIQGLFATTVTPDAPVVAPAKEAKDVQVGTYKPAETGGQPNTEAPTRLVTELAKEGPLTLNAVNNSAATHEEGYTAWVDKTQSEPSRIPKQEFISGTADNMAVTALNLDLPMDANLRTYAEAKSLELGDQQSTDANLLGSRLMADGATLMSESQYQATQSGILNSLVGEYVQYGNTEGYVVERPQGLFVVDTRPGRQDVLIESGQAGLPPAQIGIKLLPAPDLKMSNKRVGAGKTPRQLVADAQLDYDQIKLNDALDLLVLSMPAAEAEAFLEGLDDRLSANVTPAQVAKEIENEINQPGFAQANTINNAIPSEPSTNSSSDASPNAERTSALGRPTPTSSAPDWTPTSVEARIQEWYSSVGGGKIPADVKILSTLPAWASLKLQQGVDSGELRLVGKRGEPVSSTSFMAVNGARRGNTTYLFAGNMDPDIDPVSTLLHETWHKFQNVEGALRLNEALDKWRIAPKNSIEYQAWVVGEQALAGDVTGGSLERIPKILNFLWEKGTRPDQRSEPARFMDKAFALLMRLAKALGMSTVTPSALIGLAQALVVDNSNGVEASNYLSDKTLFARAELNAKKTKDSQQNFSAADISKLTDKGRSLKEFSQQFAGDIKQADKTVKQADNIATEYIKDVLLSAETFLPTVTGATLSYKQYLMMPDGKTYDPASLEHIAATDLTKRIYAAVSNGTIGRALEAEAKETNKSREVDLQKLATYLLGNADYRPTEAAVILKAAAKWGMRLTTNNGKAEVQLVEITNKNATAIAVVNGLDAAALSNKMLEGLPLKAAFQAALQETTDNREKAAKASGKEGWVVYKKSDKHKDHVALRDGCAGREWCTAGAVSTAATQLRQGDFHIFYAKGQPVVALRTVNGRLDEAPRGSLAGQALTPYEREVAERRLRGIPESGGSQTPTVQGGEDFLSDQKVLADIQSGAIKDYSDLDLWMLQAYKMKAGDYSGDVLPKAAKDAVKEQIQTRKSPKQWASEGYVVAEEDTNWATAKYVAGNMELRGSTSAPLVTAVGGYMELYDNASAPLVTSVGEHMVLYDNAAAPLVTAVGGYMELYDNASAPLVTAVGGYMLLSGNTSAPLVTAVGGNMELRGSTSAPLVTRQNIGKVEALKGTPLDPNYVAPKVEPTPIAGGEDFLSDQKVLADIQSGAIKDYSDLDLWMLQAYKMKAGDYSGDVLPKAAKDAVKEQIQTRKSPKQWASEGYVVAEEDTNWATAKYVAGDMELYDNTSAPLVTAVGGSMRLYGKASAPLVTTVEGDLELSGDTSAPLVTSIGGNLSLYANTSAPLVTSVGKNMGLYGKASAPLVASVGGKMTLGDSASALLVTAVGGDMELYDNTSAPLVTAVGGSMRLYGKASAPLVTAVGGNMTIYADTAAPLVTRTNIGKEAALKGTPLDPNYVAPAATQPTVAGGEDFSIGDRARLLVPRTQPRSLEDRLSIVEKNRLPKSFTKVSDLITDVKDWTAKVLVDGTRPFDVWARKYGTAADQAALLQKKSVAKTRASAYVSKIDGTYTQQLAKEFNKIFDKTEIKDSLTAKELVGTWMTVRYAQVKNAEFIKQDQETVDKAEQAFVAAGGDLVGLRADLARVSTGRNRLTDLTIAAAKRFTKATDATRTAASAYALALDKQEKRINAVNDPDNNLDPVKTPLAAGLAGGYNNATAAEVQRRIEAKIPVDLLESAAKPVYEMLAANVKQDLSNGKIALSIYAKWGKDPLYVPLTGDPRTDDTASDVFGTGSVNQSKDKRAEGRSSSLAQNGIDAAYEQVGKSAQYHGWLPFKQELTKIYENLVAQEGGDTEAVYNKYGIKRRRESEMTDLSSSVIFRNGADVNQNGSGWAYTFDSVAAIEALRHANMEQRPGWLAPVGWATTMSAKLITQWSPGFALVNMWRDGPERFVNLSTRTLANYPNLNMNAIAGAALVNWGNPATALTAQIVLAEKLSMFDLAKSIANGIKDFSPDKDIAYMREMLEGGASSTTGAYLSRDSDTLAQKIASINGWDSKIKNVLVIWNDTFELRAPYAMYKALREAGVDKDAAAATVLGTMDFGKAGTAMAPIKVLYMFAQPIMTGANQMVMTLSTAKGRAIALAMTTVAMGLYAMLSDMAGEDEETKRRRMASISSTTLERNVPIILADGTVLKIPVPFGLFQLGWGVGANVMRALNGEQTPAETVGELAKMTVKTFSPVSTSETSVARDPLTWAVQTFTPSVLKPVANSALNRGAFGGKLDSREFLDPSQAKWKFAKPGTPELYVEASKWLLTNAGMNTSPEVIKELSNMVAVGPLAEARKGFVDNPTKDAHGVPRPSQWFDRYLALQTTADVIAPAYYHAKGKVGDVKTKIDAGKEVTQGERQLLAMGKADDSARKAIAMQWSALRKQENAGTVQEAAYKERFQNLKRLELEAQKRFLIRYNELSK